MRPWNRILVCGWVLTLATAWAQVPPEIKDAPTAAAFPGADGVVLLEKHEIVLDAEGKASWTQRRLTRIFRDHAIGELGDPRITFDAENQQLEVLGCRVWMRDGTPVDTPVQNGYVEVTPDALERAVDYTRLRQMVLVHTGVEHGATLELSYRITDRTPQKQPLWGEMALQGGLPVLKQQIVVRVPEGTPLVIQGCQCELKPEKTTHEGVDTYTVTRTNVPAVNLAECAGHARDVAARLVYSTAPSWTDVGTQLDKAVEHALDSSDALKQRVASLTAGVGTPFEQVSAVHAFVADQVRDVRWPLADFGFTPRPASRVYESAYGHALDKAVLLKAMLKEAGIASAVVLASTTSAIAMRAPSPTQLDDVWVLVENDKHRVWLDPMAPLAARSGRELEGRATLRLSARGSSITRAPVSAADANTAVLTGSCRVDASGAISGRLQLDLAGALNPYDSLRGGSGPLKRFADRVASTLGGARAHNHALRHFDEQLSALTLDVEGGRWTESDPDTKQLGVPELPAPLARGSYQIFRNQRTTPLFLDSAASESIELTLCLPAGYRAVYVPADVKLENAVGSLSLAFTLDPNGKLLYRKTFTLKKNVVQPEDYPAFRQLITAQLARQNNVILLQRG